MKRYFYAIAVLALSGMSVTAQEFDDIYYNPKKDNTQTVQKKNKKSNYIKDFSSMDIDEYNRRGQYYESPIDTIGVNAEMNEDFVYTQKIQKFYNPTIVIDNINLLEDVLANSYGNVDIVFEDGLPYFNSIYGWPGYYNYYSWMPSWRWGGAYSWSYSPVWGYEYWPSWSLGPSWAWGPGYNWGFSPAWSWSPIYGWGWGPSFDWGWRHPFYANYRPGGRMPNYPGNNWANNTRPGGGNVGRPTSNRPGYNASHSSAGNHTTTTNYHRTYSGNSTTSNRAGSLGSTSGRGTYSVGSDGHRRYGSSSGTNSSSFGSGRGSSSSGSTSGTHRNTSTYNSGNSSTYNSGSSNRSSSYTQGGSYGSGRSSSGSYGGGRSSSGGGRSGGRR